jgi:plasmid stabilization system protein ParE
MPRLVFSKAARKDLAKIEADIEEVSASSEAAQAFVEQIIRKCTRLAGFETRIGRRRPELLPDLRSYPYRNYVIFFRYSGGAFYIVNILYGACDIDAIFSEKTRNRRSD